ncbi:MAG: FAD/NAD(P)-binding protein [Candidatus Margulisiibacteriota bacterium]
MNTLYTPELATIKKVIPQTAWETFYELELDARPTLGHKPGQFVMVSVFGVGEAPISITSLPLPDQPTFELCVRKVGNVTGALANLKPGDKVGIRGPFGNGFDLSRFKGRDVLFIAGGIGLIPLRSLILTTLNRPADYGKVFILYGCKTPKELLYKGELKTWECKDNVECQVTVDLGDEDWQGNVGVITTLLPKITFDPRRTQAAIVGPPVMYRFVIKELLARRMPEGNIWMSLERKMKCGVGKCGHCQMNNIYVCQEGPVFNYSEVKALPEAV